MKSILWGFSFSLIFLFPISELIKRLLHPAIQKTALHGYPNVTYVLLFIASVLLCAIIVKIFFYKCNLNAKLKEPVPGHLFFKTGFAVCFLFIVLKLMPRGDVSWAIRSIMPYMLFPAKVCFIIGAIKALLAVEPISSEKLVAHKNNRKQTILIVLGLSFYLYLLFPVGIPLLKSLTGGMYGPFFRQFPPFLYLFISLLFSLGISTIVVFLLFVTSGVNARLQKPVPYVGAFVLGFIIIGIFFVLRLLASLVQGGGVGFAVIQMFNYFAVPAKIIFFIGTVATLMAVKPKDSGA